MKSILQAVLLTVVASYAAAAEPCDSFRDSRARSAIDFAPPIGFIDVCSRDAQLCNLLTKGYPPSVQTIGYFVRAEEWQRYQKTEQKGFSRYLIAQRARTTMSTTEFADFKRYIRGQQGNTPDHTELPSVLESQGRVPLGVTDETDDSISFGVVMKLVPPGGGGTGSELLASINIARQLKGETLSLYAFDTVRQPTEVEGVKTLARHWIACIGGQNAR